MDEEKLGGPNVLNSKGERSDAAWVRTSLRRKENQDYTPGTTHQAGGKRRGTEEKRLHQQGHKGKKEVDSRSLTGPNEGKRVIVLTSTGLLSSRPEYCVSPPESERDSPGHAPLDA